MESKNSSLQQFPENHFLSNVERNGQLITNEK